MTVTASHMATKRLLQKERSRATMDVAERNISGYRLMYCASLLSVLPDERIRANITCVLEKLGNEIALKT